MNKLQRIALGLALAATLNSGAAASAQNNGQKPRALSGTILRVDQRTRTLEVREDGTGRTIAVRVPEGATVRTNIATQPAMHIERLIPGMALRNVIVQ